MRVYEVGFAHTDFGHGYLVRRVAVRGYAAEAIEKAERLVAKESLGVTNKDRLRVEEVTLITECK